MKKLALTLAAALSLGIGTASTGAFAADNMMKKDEM